MTTRAPRKAPRQTPSAAPTAAPPAPPKHQAGSAPQYGGAQASAAEVPTFATVTEGAPLPMVTPREQFVLLWNITQWHIMDGRLVPALQQKRLKAGVSGVARQRNGVVDIAIARAEWERRGWRMIPYDRGPGGSYMRAQDVDPDGMGRQRRRHHHTAWETLYSGSPRVVTDEAAYADWCEQLVTDGLIPPCPLPIASALHERTIAKLATLEERLGRGAASLAPQIESLRAELAILTEYIDSFSVNAAPVASAIAAPELAGEVSDG